jgi:hypothetical protein
MTQNDHEILVEKYLAGDMSIAEESDFFINVALDNNLRQTLRAQHTLRRALASDMQTAVPQQAAYRTNIMALLATTQVIGGAGIGAGVSGAASGSGAAGAGAAAAGSVATGTILTKVILGTALGLSLVGGTLYVADQLSNSSDQPATPNAAPVQRQLEVLPPQLQPPTAPTTEQPAQQQQAAEPTKRHGVPSSTAKQGGNSTGTIGEKPERFNSGDEVHGLSPTTTSQNGEARVTKEKVAEDK